MTEKNSLLTQEIKPADITMPIYPFPRVRIRLLIFGVILGFLVVMIGAKPAWFGLDRSPVVGFHSNCSDVDRTGNHLYQWLYCHPCPMAQTATHHPCGYRRETGEHRLRGHTIFRHGRCSRGWLTPIAGITRFRGLAGTRHGNRAGIIAIGFVMMFPYKQKNKTGSNSTP